jgi:hypothetical protein
MADAMPPFRPLEGRAHWAKRALSVAVLLGVISLVADFQQWSLTKRIAAREATLDEVQMNDTIQLVVTFAGLAALVVAGVFFLRWFHRAYANLTPLGARGLPHGAGWAVGYWFVPLINLFRPAAVASAIWNASVPSEDSKTWKDRKQPGLVVAWWLTWVLSGIGTWAGIRLWDSAADPTGLRHAAVVFLLADVLFITAGVLAIAFIRKTTARQETRASSLQPVLPLQA